MDSHHNEGFSLFVKALLALETEEECADFLEDVMSRKEVSDISQRMYVAKLLSEQVVYNKIAEKTGASTATISRVNRCYVYGTGGYKKSLAKIADKDKIGK